MLKNKGPITAAAFTSLAINGMTFAFVGTSLPAMRNFMGINVEMAGVLMAVLQIGFTLFTFFGGIMSDFMMRARVLMLGCLLLGAGSFLLGVWTDYGANLSILLCMGMGAGLILSGSNALLVALYPDRKGTILNVHHVFFGIGSLVGPVVMARLLIHHRWQSGYSGTGAALVMLGLILLFSKFKPKMNKSVKLFGSQVGRLITDKNYLVLVTVSAMAVGTQLALMLLAVMFLVEAKEIPIAIASWVLTVFFVFMVLGRLVCSRLTAHRPISGITIFLLGFQFLTLFIAWRSTGWTTILFIALSGLACSGIYPGLLAMTSLLFKDVEGSALGILSTMAGIGSILICWLNGIVSQRTSIGFGFIVLVASSLIAVSVFALNYQAVHKQEALG